MVWANKFPQKYIYLKESKDGHQHYLWMAIHAEYFWRSNKLYWPLNRCEYIWCLHIVTTDMVDAYLFLQHHSIFTAIHIYHGDTAASIHNAFGAMLGDVYSACEFRHFGCGGKRTTRKSASDSFHCEQVKNKTLETSFAFDQFTWQPQKNAIWNVRSGASLATCTSCNASHACYFSK